MFKAVKAAFASCDGLIMAAAVSDYKPAKTSSTKLKKQNTDLMLRLVPTRDILAWAGRHKQPHQRVCGFALEDRNILENAEHKLRKKKLDMIVANAPSAIGTATSTLYLKTKTEQLENSQKCVESALFCGDYALFLHSFSTKNERNYTESGCLFRVQNPVGLVWPARRRNCPLADVPSFVR